MTDAGFGLLGVCIGFALAVAWQEWKEYTNRETLRNALRDELKVNLHFLPLKRKILKQLQDASKNSWVSRLPTENPCFLRTIYDNHLPTLSICLRPREKGILHVIYEHLQFVDDTMDSFKSSVASAGLGENLDSVNMFSAGLTDFGPLFDTLGVGAGYV